ncbi:2-oxoisovalerate dehydrogenase subunit alpha 2, mitochondrial-like [Camellia sinensis]|uniref:2-oxoisovalerate dehydrogenase subunit alpha 2, mitochondrial-like n=1 Tax=Camellia sinensis TaxID=4442 RepID=UPI0010369E16|nr:2-oxoisovalerate dehydrogenase subunit alpha 2, mitochondrial-like [Camellia sinensis]
MGEQGDALKMYSSMVTLQTMDNIFYEAQRQGRMSFYCTSYGEDAINIVSAAALTQDDIILPQLIRLDRNFNASVIHLQLS